MTTITCTIYLYPGTEDQLPVKVRAEVFKYAGRIYVHGFETLGYPHPSILTVHEHHEVLDQVAEHCLTYESIPEECTDKPNA